MSQKNPKKIIALLISIAAHAALIYYLGSMALDYALPEGTVSSFEVDYSSPAGSQVDNVNVDVVNAPPPAPVAKPVAPTPPKIAPIVPKTTSKAPPTALPEKAAVAENVQGTMPVPVEVPESTTPATDPFAEAQEQTPTEDKSPEPVAEAPEATPAPALPSGADTTNQAYGRPEGVQSDTVLSPLAGNKKISYPTMARFRKLEGETIVNYAVSADGNVTDVTLVQSSGHSVLDDSVIDTVKTWKFNPTGREGVYERPVKFSLKGEAVPSPSRLRRPNP